MSSPILKKLSTRWAALSASEQRTLQWGAVVLLPALFYGLLWQPAHEAVPRLQVTVPQLRAQLAQMHAQGVEVQTLRQGVHPAVIEGNVLLGIVKSATETAGWATPLVVVEQAENNSVRVSAESLEFARWVSLLRELESTHHVRVDSVTVNATATQGMVKLSAVLSNGEAQ